MKVDVPLERFIVNAADSTDSPTTWITHLSSEDIQALGQSLRRIDSGMMKAGDEKAGQRVWYQSREPYFDVILELTCQDDSEVFPGCINWCQFTLRGKVLLWRQDPERLQTGETEELDVPPMLSYYAASKTIRAGASLDHAFIELVIAILRSRSDDPLLTELRQTLEKSAPQSA